MSQNAPVGNVYGLEYRQIFNSNMRYKKLTNQTIIFKTHKMKFHCEEISQYKILIPADCLLPIPIYRYKYMSGTVLL